MPVSLELFVSCHAKFVRIKDVTSLLHLERSATCRNADKLTFIWVERVRPVIEQKLDNALNISFIPSDVQVWVTEVTHSASHQFSELPQVHAAVLRSEIIPLHSSPFQAKALCFEIVPPAVSVSRLTVSSMVWSTGMRLNGFWATS